jgi:hypothetical protein
MSIDSFSDKDPHVIPNSFHRQFGCAVPQGEACARLSHSPFAWRAVGSGDAEWSIVVTAI